MNRFFLSKKSREDIKGYYCYTCDSYCKDSCTFNCSYNCSGSCTDDCNSSCSHNVK